MIPDFGHFGILDEPLEFPEYKNRSLHWVQLPAGAAFGRYSSELRGAIVFYFSPDGMVQINHLTCQQMRNLRPVTSPSQTREVSK